jgi:hypothetical protein
LVEIELRSEMNALIAENNEIKDKISQLQTQTDLQNEIQVLRTAVQRIERSSKAAKSTEMTETN